jgi:DNA-binding winged helix-turn-helix (wHTH) protein/tetratricopeptide (TPR) repeat protein
MTATSGKSFVYRFGVFTANPDTGELLKKGVRIKLQDQPFRLLCLFLERSGEIVTKEDVRERLWPGNTFVEFDASLSVAVGKVRDALGDDPDEPRFIETVPRRGYRFIASVETVATAANSASQPADAPAPGIAEGRVVVEAPSAEPPGLAPTHRAKFGVMAALLICAMVVAAVAAHRFRARAQSLASSAAASRSAVAPVPVRRSVAVLGFRNLPGRAEENWLSSAFSEMLNTELGEGGSLRMVSGEDVAHARAELPSSGEDTLAKGTLEKLRINPGADVVILGSYTTLRRKGQNRIRLDLRAQDTKAGETIAEESVTGSEENLFELAAQAGARMRQSLGVLNTSGENTAEARSTLPGNQRALQFYAEGRAKLWQYEIPAALVLLQEAVAADPNYPLAHSALSEAWWHQGYRVKARNEARRAMELSKNLPEEERLLVEGQYRRAVADWPKAVETYRALYNLFPDRVDYGLLLAAAESHTSMEASAQTLAQLRRLPPPSGNNPSIDIAEGTIWISHDFARANAAAKRALDKGIEEGSPAIVTWSYGLLCEQGVVSGKSTAESLDLCEKALQHTTALGDPNGRAMVLVNLSAIRFQQGDIAQAQTMFDQALKIFRQIGNTEGEVAVLSNLGAAKVAQGDLFQAKKLIEESIPANRAIGDDEGLALSFNNLGDVERLMGQLDAAESNYNQGKAIASKIDNKNALAYIESGLGDVFMDRGDLAAARKSYEAALALRTELAERLFVGETQVSLARLAIEEGHPADAEAAMKICRKQFHDDQQSDDELAASLVLIDALFAQGKYAEAKTELAVSEPLAAKGQSLFSRLKFDLASARTPVGAENPDPIRAKIKRTVQEAHAHGYVGLEFEARLALVQLENQNGHQSLTQTQLADLESSANAKGFGLIARKAAAARV